MTTLFPSFGSLRALAASRRRGHLAGGTWSTTIDRDLDRVASDLLVLSHVDAERLASSAAAITQPVDLGNRRARGLRPAASGATPPRVRAS